MNKNQEILEAIKLFVQEEEGLPEEPEALEAEENLLKIVVKKEKPEVTLRVREPLTIYMKIRKALNGDYLIYDHPLYDIVIMPKKNKVVTFAKRGVNYEVYPYQDKLFDFLLRRGMLELDSVQSGNIFGSLEAKYPINDKVDTVETLLFVLYQFLKGEVNDVKTSMSYDDEISSHYTDPDDEDSTELGEVPHEEEKGSIDPGYKPYGLVYRL